MQTIVSKLHGKCMMAVEERGRAGVMVEMGGREESEVVVALQ